MNFVFHISAVLARFVALSLVVVLTACGSPSSEPTPQAAPNPRASAPAAQGSVRATPDSTAMQPGMSGDSLLAARARLEDALGRYRRIAGEGGWPTIPDDGLVEPGDTAAAQVEPLRARLAVTDELGEAASSGTVYDAPLAAALARFQARHGLMVDSLLGADTRAALNRSAEARVRQIEQTLDRWADLPEIPTGPGSRYVMVNVPEFTVRAFDDGRETLQMEVVVGATYDDRATPLFHDQMDHVIFRPFWNVPPSIARDELVPDGPEVLEEEGFEIVGSYAPDAEVYPMTEANLQRVGSGALRIRQKAGPDNALGLVKFMFPNQYAVYLHDTPAEQLFEEAERAFSHGCIRLERPAAFGAWVLGPKGWDEARVRDVMQTGERERVDLEEEIPVYIVYLPVWADADGTVHFAQDIYDELDG